MRVTYSALGKVGRLGNQLWQIASTAGIAERRDAVPMFDPGWIYRPWFCIPDEFFEYDGKDDIVDSTWMCEELDLRARPYLQRYSLMEPVAAQVREWFQPSDLAMELINKHRGLIPGPGLTTAVHVRRGDNLLPDHDGYYEVPGESYYRRALGHFDGYPVFFSDDIDWCMKTFQDLDAVFIVPNILTVPEDGIGERVTPALDWLDMQLMALCDYHVISNSTYSWWGAFLSGDAVVARPKCWFGPKIDWTNVDLMMPKGWFDVPC